MKTISIAELRSIIATVPSIYDSKQINKITVKNNDDIVLHCSDCKIIFNLSTWEFRVE